MTDPTPTFQSKSVIGACETDFVAKNESYVSLANQLARLAWRPRISITIRICFREGNDNESELPEPWQWKLCRPAC